MFKMGPDSQNSIEITFSNSKNYEPLKVYKSVHVLDNLNVLLIQKIKYAYFYIF